MKYNKFISESNQIGPRQFEVPYVLNNLIPGNTIEIGGNSSLFKGVLIRRGEPFTLIDPMNPAFNEGRNHKLATCIHGDIRKYSIKELGQFNNVLLVSVLEHIGLKAYNMPKDWEFSPAQEQLKAFSHCMSFVKPKGRIICTLPYGTKIEEKDPKFLLRYTNKMLKNLYQDYKLIDLKFFTIDGDPSLDRWKEVPEKETYKRRSNVCFVLEK